MEDNAAPDTSNFLDWVEIKNFKSIKDLRLDCKRVNIFIGKPNVGKSNILEALGMLGAEYFVGHFMNGAVRYKNLKHLFYQNDSIDPVSILTDTLRLTMGLTENDKDSYHLLLESSFDKNEVDIKENLFKSPYFNWNDSNGYLSTFKSDGQFVLSTKREALTPDTTRVIKYDYSGITEFIDSYRNFLLPNGKNLFGVIDRRRDLKNEFGKIFLEQGLDLVLDQEKQSFSIQRKDDYYIYRYDYYTIADTFRRFIFYIAAIESNKNSVLILEEPEVHSFPPYTQEMAYRMIYDTDNQYFLSTHSPYMLHPFIEKMDYKDLNVFVTYYENYQTHVKALDYEEFRDILDYSTNIFFNLDRFTPNATNKVAP